MFRPAERRGEKHLLMKRTSVNITFVSLENLLPFAERMKTSSTTAAQAGYVSLVTGPRQPPMTYPIPELAGVASSSVRNNNLQSGPLELISNVILQPEHLVTCDVPPAVRGLQTLHQGETRLFFIYHQDRWRLTRATSATDFSSHFLGTVWMSDLSSDRMSGPVRFLPNKDDFVFGNKQFVLWV